MSHYSTDWQIVLGEVQSLQEHARSNGYPLWYRGHSCAHWKLQTSLHRHIEKGFLRVPRSFPEVEKIEVLREVYKSLYRKYKARAWHVLSLREMSDWGIIFSMQHHGIPTRLLDWTESFACAVYFAHQERESNTDAAIFVLSPEHLNEHNFGQPGQVALGDDVREAANIELILYHPGYVSPVRPLHTIAVAPVLSNPRMLAQQSTFTLAGDPFQPLEERYPAVIKKIILPASTYSDSLKFLDLVGAGHFGYFPDFEGLRNELLDDLNNELNEIEKLFKNTP